ncbi:MAG: type II secretion system F family protein [Actinobacteria bacterium]|nr:type II secretion system F family protein [Actinomycetota bacterium]
MIPAVLAGVLAAAAVASAGAALASGRAGAMLVRAGSPPPAGRDRSSPPPVGRWRGGLPWRRVERALLVAAGVAIGLRVAGPPGVPPGAAAGWFVGTAIGRRRVAAGTAALEDQLAGSVAAVAAALRGGMSLAGAIRYAAEEAGPPLGSSLGAVVDRSLLGVPLADSIEAWAGEVAGHDARLVADALQLHHSVGGDLPAVLDQVARTLRERRSAAREVRALTAQARLSGTVLGLLPLGFLLFLQATSGDDLVQVYRTPVGLGALLAGLALQGAAFLWIRRLLRVEA